MIDFFKFVEICELRAIQAALNPTDESVWRMKLREYSERFHTPLHEAAQLDPEFILQHLNEHEFTPKDIQEDPEGILEMLRKIQDPTYAPIEKEELEDLVDAAINSLTKKGLGKRKKITEEPVDLPSPKKGNLKFNDLAQVDAESEQNTSGFED